MIDYALKNGIALATQPPEYRRKSNAHFCAILIPFGFLPDKSVGDYLDLMSTVSAKTQVIAWCNAAKKITGVNVDLSGLLSDTVNIALEFDPLIQTWRNYLKTGEIEKSQTGNRVLNRVRSGVRIPVQIGDYEDVARVIESKFESATLSQEDITAFRSILTIADVSPKGFATRENAALFAATKWTYGNLKTPVDVLYLAAWMSGFHPKELGKKKFALKTHKQKRFVKDALENVLTEFFFTLKRDIGEAYADGREEQFKRLAKQVHFDKQHPKALAWIDSVCKGRNAKRLGIDSQLPVKDKIKAATSEHILKNALALVRNYRGVLTNPVFLEKISDASTIDLLKLFGHCQSNYETKISRLPLSKYWEYEPKVKNEGDTIYAEELTCLVRSILVRRFAESKVAKYTLYVDSDFSNTVLPFYKNIDSWKQYCVTWGDVADLYAEAGAQLTTDESCADLSINRPLLGLIA